MRQRCEPDPIGEGGIAVFALQDVRDAFDARAPNRPADAEGEHAFPARVLKAGFERQGKARPTEAEILANQIVGRDTFKSRAESERESLDAGDGIGDSGLNEILIRDGCKFSQRILGSGSRVAKDVGGVLRCDEVAAVKIKLGGLAEILKSIEGEDDSPAPGARLDGVIDGNGDG